MGVAEELSRLVELRDRGVLTQKEFDRKKKQILNGGRGASRFMTWVAGLVAFMILAGVAVKLFERFASTELACDTPEVQEKVLALINQQSASLFSQLGYGGLAPAMQIHGIGKTQELYRDPKSGFLACLGRTQHARGEGDIGYTLSWRDRARGEFWVEIANSDVLRARYASARKDQPSSNGKRVAFWQGDEGSVTLLDGNGSCYESERSAILKREDGSAVSGCWGYGNESVAIRWSDDPKPWEFLATEFTTISGYKWR